MAASALISSQQSSSITTTLWSSGEELKQVEAKSVPNVGDSTSDDSSGNKSSSGQAKAASVNSSTLSTNFSLTKIQESVMKGALEKFAEVREQMAKIWEEIFGVRPNSESGNKIQELISQNRFDTLLNMSSQTRTELASSGISVSAGYAESLSINMQGTIIAQDGTKKEINVSLNVSQSFMLNIQNSVQTQQNSGSISHWGEEYGLVDPLVIDYEGNGTELSDDTFHFDLDNDGESDQISTLKKGSGFLALDKNGDGTINNGSELFGTQNGDGFKDLAQYDSNGDGKIDKNDPIYDKLRIWTPDKNGNGKLIGLGEVGIGVIYLDSKEVGEKMYANNGDLLGVKQKTGSYERADGSTGSIHHIDLAKQNSATNTKESANTQISTTEEAPKDQAQSLLDRIKGLLFGSNVSFSGSFSVSYTSLSYTSLEASSATTTSTNDIVEKVAAALGLKVNTQSTTTSSSLYGTFSQALEGLLAGTNGANTGSTQSQQVTTPNSGETSKENQNSNLDSRAEQELIEKFLLSFQFQRIQLNLERSFSSNQSTFEAGFSASYSDLNYALLQDIGKSNTSFDVSSLMGNRASLLR